MLLITGGMVVTLNPARDVIEDGAVLIDGDRIAAVGSAAALEREHPSVERLDARGKAVLPGLINTHTHLFQTLLKGPGDDKPLHEWLTAMTLPAACALTEEDCYLAALHGGVESIRSGCTTIVDFMYVHPRPGLTDAVIRGLDEAGMRGIVARGYATTGSRWGMPEVLIESPDAVLADCERLLARQGGPGERIRVGLGPCILWMVDEGTLAATRRLADRTGSLITIHLAETSYVVEQALSEYGDRELPVLGRCGVLGPDLLAVHCTKSTDEDIELMRRHDVKGSHNPCSNMYLASGVAPIPRMLQAGLSVGLGSDGPASNNSQNMIQVMKFAALLQKAVHEDATIMTAEKVLEMATIDGARAIGMEREIGSLEPGKKADLFVAAFDNPHVTPLHSPISALVYSALGNEPETVLVDGRVVMRDRVVLTLDEADVRTRAQRAAGALAERAGIAQLARRPWRSIGPRRA